MYAGQYDLHFERDEAGDDGMEDPLMQCPILRVSLFEMIIPVFRLRSVCCYHVFPII